MDLNDTPLIVGFATFQAGDYQDPKDANVTNASQAVDAALSSPYFNAIDTSPWYYPSEQTLGHALQLLRDKHPRESYFLISKCGRYRPQDGPNMFDYSREKLTQSVNESLRRLKTTYLDLILLHDVEFVAEPVGQSNAAGQPTEALANPAAFGLDDTSDDKVTGEGDQKVLDAIRLLFEFKRQGIVRKVGLSGYPLSTLLRLAILVKKELGEPLDAVLSYAHHTLLSFPPGRDQTNFQHFVPLFEQRAGVKQLINASPLGMGLLREVGAPKWHPASQELQDLAVAAVPLLSGTTLPHVALQFGLKPILDSAGHRIPTVVGLANATEAHASILAYERALDPAASAEQVSSVKQFYQKSIQTGCAWASGRQNTTQHS